MAETKPLRARGVTPKELAARKVKQREDGINRAIERINAELDRLYDPLKHVESYLIHQPNLPPDCLGDILAAFTGWSVKAGVSNQEGEDVPVWHFSPAEYKLPDRSIAR